MRLVRSVDASLLGLGTQMLSEVAAGVLLGIAADYMLGTKNRWVVVGSLAGIIVAMWTVVRVAMRVQGPRRQPPRSSKQPRSHDSGNDSGNDSGDAGHSRDETGGGPGKGGRA